MAGQGSALGGSTMRYLGYGLAIVIGIVGLVSGIVGHQGVVAGASIGWLIAAIVNIVMGMNATVEAKDDAFFAIFDVPWYIWIADVALIVVGGVIGRVVGG
jgi:hypothetical protein